MTALKTIARIECDLKQKFGIPRQSNLVRGLQSLVVFEPEYRSEQALRGLEGFSHLWLIWGFSEHSGGPWSPTVRPPRLGGNTRVGVFATRSPNRPNPIGLSSVRLERVAHHPSKGPVLHLLGADLMDQTPIYDIKPYIAYTDCHADATGGFAQGAPQKLRVEEADHCLHALPEQTRGVLLELLAYDPRPPYQNDPGRVYGMRFGAYDVKFSVNADCVTVHALERL